jgi:hypothetical protein
MAMFKLLADDRVKACEIIAHQHTTNITISREAIARQHTNDRVKTRESIARQHMIEYHESTRTVCIKQTFTAQSRRARALA